MSSWWPGVVVLLSLHGAIACGGVEKRSVLETPPGTWSQSSIGAKESPTVGTAQSQGQRKTIGDRFGFSSEPILAELIEEALANNPDLAVARATVERARAVRSQAAAARLPSVGLLGSASIGSSLATDQTTAQYSVGLNVSWEPDVWNRLGRRIDASGEIVAAADEDRRAAKRLLAAEVIIAYLTAVEAQLQVTVGRRNLESLRRTLGYVEVQFERGLRSGQDISLIRADVSTADAGLASSLNLHRQSLRALEVLVGRYPTAELKTTLELPSQPDLGSAGIPAELLENRPDLRAARHRLEAARASSGGLERDRFPQIRLNGTIAAASERAVDIASKENVGWQLGAEVRVPLVDGGLRQALVAEGRAEITAAAERYQATALQAFLEVEEQLDRQAVLGERYRAVKAALGQARKARGFAQFRYESGGSDLLDVLSIQGRVLSLESALVALERERLVNHVALFLAVGSSPGGARL